ncbi:BnaCnng11220D [Brassica napus]|uniref:BnaCnng11220D protein n=2 Tax=Brassica TaxID=3705 RepID=A0A078I4M1_BRANA|nr:BnaCnng11220D [Brassica napus]
MPQSNLEKLWDGVQPLVNLKKLILDSSYRLKEIPNLSNATNLETLSLSSCSSLVELPSSIRNLHKLEKLIMRSCKKLRLKTFPEFSSNIWYLDVSNTKIKDVPASVVGRWSRCRGLDIGSKSLKRLTNIPLSVTKLDLINSDIKRIPECITGLPQLEYLIVENCTNLVSIPALPPSLKSLNANNCLSLKTVHCSFHSPLKELTFYNCVKLDEEARRGIIQQPVYQYICLPAKEVPSEFTHRGNSITISEASFSASSRFKVCFLVSPIEDCGFITIGCCLRSKEGVVINSFFSEARVYELSPLSEHLFILHCERRNRRHDVATSEITFEFSCVYNDEKIIECGVHVLAEAAEVDNIELGSNSCEVDGDYEAEAFMVSQGENIKTSKNTRWSWLQKLGLKKKMNKTKQTS